MRQVSLREFRTRGSKALEAVPDGETVLLAGQNGPAYFLIRLVARGKVAENKVEQTKALILYYLQTRQVTKMEGKQFTLRCQKNSQDSVRISDPELLPHRLKRIEARFDGETWLRIIAALPEDLRPVLNAGIQSMAPMNDAIKQAIAQKDPVEGAAVVRGHHIRVA